MSEEKDIAIQITGLKKMSRLGVIGGGTLRGDIQSWWARVRHKEDPNKKIGAKTYGKNETFMALDGIDLTIYKGERIGIIGHNGAGKSTLLKLLSRVTGPTEGEIKIDGRISSMLEVGTGFNRELTGRENIYLNGAILGMTKKEVDSKIEDIIEFSEVRQFIDTPVKRYSSGMYVKLAFSVAAHLDSEILIMDEVLAVGDMAFQQKCLNKMNQVSQDEGRTILYVSHNMSTIRQLCNRCVVMSHGKVVFNGDVESAIGKYIGIENTEGLVHYDFRNVVRPNIDNGELIFITDFSFIDKEVPNFERTEFMKFKISFKTSEKMKGVKFFLAVSKQGKQTVGLAQTYKGLDIDSPGELNEQVFKMNISNLSPGKYKMALHAFVADEIGNAMSYDYPGVGISFTVIDSFPKGIKWRDQWYGTVILNEIELC